MRNFIVIGSTPYNEDCVQVNRDASYFDDMKKECARFKRGIENYFKKEMDTGISLRIKTFEHDFGPYCEVVCFYETESEEQVNAAFKIEEEIPRTWEELEKNVNDNRKTS